MAKITRTDTATRFTLELDGWEAASLHTVLYQHVHSHREYRGIGRPRFYQQTREELWLEGFVKALDMLNKETRAIETVEVSR